MGKMSATVFVYGFPPGMELEEFKTEFFEDIDIDSYVQRIDFKKEKIFAFIHVNNVEQANELIEKWNGKPMAKSGENHKIQVSLKSENPNPMTAKPNMGQGNNNNNNNNNMGGGNKPFNNNNNNNRNFNNNRNQMNNNNMRNNFNNNQNNFNNRGNNRNNYNNFNQQGGYNNFNQQNNGYNNFNNQQGGYNNNRNNNNFNNNNNNFNNNNRNNNNDNNGQKPELPGPQKPVLYVYGFPKEMDQPTFEEAFLGAEGSDDRTAVKQNDYFQEKIYAFLHFEDHDVCERLIEKWDGKHLEGYDQGKPMQVRYKGMDHKTINLLNNTQPVLWVYGFPKGMTEEQFREEFLLGLEVTKIDFFDQKLFCFVHCVDTKQCMKYINRWEGQMMAASKSALQVRFKATNNNRNNNNNNQNKMYNNQGGMGDMQNNAAMYQNTFQQSYYNNNNNMGGMGGNRGNNNFNNNFNQMNQMNQMAAYGQFNQNGGGNNNNNRNNNNNQNNNNNFAQMNFQQMNQGNQNWNQNNMAQMGMQQGYRQNNFNNNRAR